MRFNPYVGATKRNFNQALMTCLRREYGFLGSQKVLELISEDIQRLVDEFYPAPQRLSNGWMIYTGTKATSRKPSLRQTAGEFELVTLAWPVLIDEDLQELASLSEARSDRQQWLIRRLIRIVEYGLVHPNGPVLLTLADLAAMLNLHTKEVSKLLEEARQQSDKSLITKGRHFDMGMKPTHKREVIALYEQGVDEADIARLVSHVQTSVGRYIRDYERVKEALKNNVPLRSLSRLLNMLPSVVRVYAEMTVEYHPDIQIDVKDQNFT